MPGKYESLCRDCVFREWYVIEGYWSYPNMLKRVWNPPFYADRCKKYLRNVRKVMTECKGFVSKRNMKIDEVV